MQQGNVRSRGRALPRDCSDAFTPRQYFHMPCRMSLRMVRPSRRTARRSPRPSRRMLRLSTRRMRRFCLRTTRFTRRSTRRSVPVGGRVDGGGAADRGGAGCACAGSDTSDCVVRAQATRPSALRKLRRVMASIMSPSRNKRPRPTARPSDGAGPLEVDHNARMKSLPLARYAFPHIADVNSRYRLVISDAAPAS